MRVRGEARRTLPAPRVGYLCSYTPVEVLAAAGLLPARLPGGSGHGAQAMLPAALCPYLKGCLGAALDGDEPLAGLVVVTGCDGLRRLADVWARYAPGSVHVLDVPRRRGAAAEAYLASQLALLAERLAKLGGRDVDEGALRAAIAERNRTRRLLAELDGRRRELGLGAGEMLALVDASAREAPAACNSRLAARLAERVQRRPGVPVVLSGNILARSDRGVLELLEAAGAEVVGDDLCSGARGVLGEVDEASEPMAALARRYLERVPCPRMAGVEQRFDELAALCRSTGAGGAIYLSQKYCDTSLYDLAPLRERLQAAGVRTLHLELDAGAALPGQVRTRVEAFLEVL